MIQSNYARFTSTLCIGAPEAFCLRCFGLTNHVANCCQPDSSDVVSVALFPHRQAAPEVASTLCCYRRFVAGLPTHHLLLMCLPNVRHCPGSKRHQPRGQDAQVGVSTTTSSITRNKTHLRSHTNTDASWQPLCSPLSAASTPSNGAP